MDKNHWGSGQSPSDTSQKRLRQLGIKVIVQNVGRSVALHMVIRTDVVFVSIVQESRNDPIRYPVEMQKKLCAKAADGGLPINLFPGEDNQDQAGDNHGVPVSVNSFIIPKDPNLSRVIMPVFVGCVDYKIGASGKIHQSGFIYSVQQAVARQRNHSMLTVGNDIAMADVRMERLAFGGFYAD